MHLTKEKKVLVHSSQEAEVEWNCADISCVGKKIGVKIHGRNEIRGSFAAVFLMKAMTPKSRQHS